MVKDNGLTKGTCLNVNVPDLPDDEIQGVLLTKQGKATWDDIYEERIDPYGRKYYWLTGNLHEVDKDFNVDQIAIQNNYVSVTPIHFDLTDYITFEKMSNWEFDKI